MKKIIYVNYNINHDEKSINIHMKEEKANKETLSIEFMKEKIGTENFIRPLEIEHKILIWHDDEGRIGDPMNPLFNLYDKYANLIYPKLAGNLYFSSYDENGNDIGLNEFQSDYVSKIHFQFAEFAKDNPIEPADIQIMTFDEYFGE